VSVALARCDNRLAQQTVGAAINDFAVQVFGQQDDQRLLVGFELAGSVRDQPRFEGQSPLDNSGDGQLIEDETGFVFDRQVNSGQAFFNDRIAASAQQIDD